MKCLMGAENDKLEQMSSFVKLFSTPDMWYKGPFQTKTSWQASPFFLFPFFYNPRIPRTAFWSFWEGSVFSRQGNRLTWSWLSILWLYCVDRLSKQYAKMKIWNQNLNFKLKWRESQDMWKCSRRISWKILGKSTCQSKEAICLSCRFLSTFYKNHILQVKHSASVNLPVKGVESAGWSTRRLSYWKLLVFVQRASLIINSQFGCRDRHVSEQPTYIPLIHISHKALWFSN